MFNEANMIATATLSLVGVVCLFVALLCLVSIVHRTCTKKKQ